MKKYMFNKKRSIKNIIIKIIIFLIIIAIVTLIILYYKNENIRNVLDEKLLRKEITIDNTNSIEKETPNNDNIYAFDNKIIILNQNQLQIYNKNGNKIKELEIEISTPIFASSNQYLFIAEKGGNKIYAIVGEDIGWQKKLEGEIADICVNKNGYVAVNLKGTAYKNVIQIYDNTGTNILTKYISSTAVEDIAIADNNQELAIAKIDYTGINIKSIIEIIDIKAAETIKNYEAGENDLIVNIGYQKNKLVCMYDSYISIVENGDIVKITEFDQSKTLFASIEPNAYIVEIKKETKGLINSNTIIKYVNSNSKKENTYQLDNEPKEIIANKKNICLNSGTEVVFLSQNGILIKKYISRSEIQKIVLGENVAGIIYNNEIKIINL